MENLDEIKKSIYEETVRAFEGIKSATEQTVKVLSDEAKSRMDDLLNQASKELETIGKSTDKGAKKELTAVIKKFTQIISDADKEAVLIINDTLRNTKIKLNDALQCAKPALGKAVKELEKMLKEIIKYMERSIADCIKLIHEFTKIAQARLTDMSRMYVK